VIDGNPVEDIELVASPDKNFMIIMKDGKIYKDTRPAISYSPASPTPQ